MRSRTSCFNATVFRKHLKTLWPLAAAYTLLLLMSIFTQVIFYTGSDYWVGVDGPPLVYRIHNLLLSCTANVWPLVFGAYGTALGLGLFAYLMSPRLSTGLHALPLRREAHFGSAMAAGGVYILAPNLLMTVLIAAVTAINGVFTPAVFIWLMAATVLELFCLCLYALCAQATGSGIFAALLAVVMNVLFPVCENFIRMIGSSMLYGVDAGGSWLTTPLSPAIFYAHDNKMLAFSSNPYEAPNAFAAGGYLAAVAVAAVVLAALALLLYRRRPLESAGDVIAHPFLRPVFKYAMAAGCGIVLGPLAYSICFHRQHWGFLAACIVLAALIGYTGAEMLMHKTFRVMKGIGPKLALVCALSLCLCLLVGFDVLGLARRLPDVDSVNEAFLNVRGHTLTLTDPEAIARLQAANLRAVDEGAAAGDDTAYCSIYYYTSDADAHWSRSYTLDHTPAALNDPQSAISQMIALLSDPQLIWAGMGNLDEIAYIEIYSDHYHTSENSAGEDARALLAAMKADIEAGTLGHYRSWEEEVALEADGQSYYLRLVFNATRDHPYRNYAVTIYPDSTETKAFLDAYLGQSK